ncbi:hypothetical protein BGZ83_009276 [Gryganskiella cystojenkinii]|nr:hypothetical protein BGZ83_009276 [Gryganskiella cystojenkinii]
MEHTRQPSPAEHQMGGVPMRMSLSGTDTSDGNLSYSDIDDDLLEDRRILHQRVSFKDHSQGSRRAKEDMRAIARQQAEASLEGYKDYEAFKTGNQALRINRQQQQQAIVIPSDLQMTRPQAQAFIQTDDEDDYDEDDDHHHHHHHHHSEEEDDDEEDWDIQSDSGAPSSSPMYSAEAQKPTSYSTVTLPMSAPIGLSASSKKKPSNAALNSLRSRQRCLSLPADNALPPGFFKMPSTPSENWDEDFDIGSSDINVPTQVVESQISLQMDIYNIKDFASQIEDLKNLRASLRLASSSAKARNPKKHQDLSMLFQRDWEQAEVIIDLGEIAQTSTSMTTSATSATSTGPFQQPQQQQLAAGPLSLVSGKGVHYPLSPPRLTTKKSNHFNSRSKASWSRRSALASVTGTSSSPPPLPKPQPFYLQQQHQPPREPTPPAGIPIRTTSLTAQSRTLSQSSSLTGTTLAGSLDEDTCTAVDEEEEFKDRQYRPLTVDTEAAVEGTAISSRHRILSPKSWRRKSSETSTTSTVTPKDISSPLTPLPDGLSLSGGFGNGHGSPEEMEASFRRYQKSCHQQQHRHTYNYAPTAAGNGVVHSSSMPSPSRLYQKQRALEADEDTAGDDDGYESYGRPLSSSNTSSGGGGPSVGVITPIPSDRHMQVLKDILMEGLGSDVARQYMFKQGEQDHVRFSVEVIPGLLGHLKGLQRRLGDQLLELQQLTVIV